MFLSYGKFENDPLSTHIEASELFIFFTNTPVTSVRSSARGQVIMLFDGRSALY